MRWTLNNGVRPGKPAAIHRQPIHLIWLAGYLQDGLPPEVETCFTGARVISAIRDAGEVGEVLGGGTVLIYKHSPICMVSTLARRQVERFANEHPETPVYMIDVVSQRDLSQKVAAQLGVPHESPQVILVHDGKQIWSTSHRGIKADSLAEQLGRVGQER